MSDTMRVLLGGVPFGRNNVGDESILENMVKIVRKINPDADITVSTDDGDATAAKLGVKTVQLFGFAPPFSRELMHKTLVENDLFVWSGATGLSDYPEIPVEMLRIAQEAGGKTALFGVGMNEQLNPVKYKLLPGKRKAVLRIASVLTFGCFNFVEREEVRREKRARAKIAATLARADLVALRDPQSIEQVRRCGHLPKVMLGADAAIIQEATAWNDLSCSDEVRSLLESDYSKVGICISAQREVANKDELVAFFNRLVEKDEIRIVFIPMNPLTDSKIMSELQAKMVHPECAIVIEGRYEPADILAVAARLNCVISSRLHLLILSSIAHVPLIGISRGSKVDNFLKQFGLTAAGSVEDCDFEFLYKETIRLLSERESFEKRSREVRAELLSRLDNAKDLLKGVLK